MLGQTLIHVSKRGHYNPYLLRKSASHNDIYIYILKLESNIYQSTKEIFEDKERVKFPENHKSGLYKLNWWRAVSNKMNNLVNDPTPGLFY